jgi:hypothetical protein
LWGEATFKSHKLGFQWFKRICFKREIIPDFIGMGIRGFKRRKVADAKKAGERQIIEKIAGRRRGIQTAERKWFGRGGSPQELKDGRGKGIKKPDKDSERKKKIMADLEMANTWGIEQLARHRKKKT